MCGFAGEYLLEMSARVDEQMLIRRAARLAHRGPDAVGTWCGGHVGFVHARLTLLDPEHGSQPMCSPRGTVLSYNGEIYNNTELRAELIAHGWQFRTRSDTEVLLAAYETWETAAWERLNGMFAFALYDPREERLYLVRDRLGIKPAFYRLTDRGVEFGSEPSAWEHLHSGPASLNPVGIVHYLRFAQPAFGVHTLFADLRVLEPGTQLVVSRDRAAIERWFAPAAGMGREVGEGLPVVRAKLRHLLHLAVGRQMVADAPVGVFLSGGVDSAVLTGLLAQMSAEPPRTYTIALEGDEAELAAARVTAARWRCRHRERTVSPSDFFAALDRLVSLRRLPTAYPNEALIFLLAQDAAADVKAVLTGEGADELFGGYTRILSVLEMYRRAMDAAGRGDRLLLTLLQAQHPQLDYGSDSRFFASVFSWFTRSELEALLQPRWREALHAADCDDPFGGALSSLGDADPDNRFHWLLEYAHLPNLLARLDGATMGASLEGRVPYTDSDLVRYASSLPAALKFGAPGPDKPLLRQSFSDLLPPELLARAKRPFDASLERLFASPEGQRELARLTADGPLSELVNTSAVRMWISRNDQPGWGQKCWLLVSLNRWLNRNIR